MAVKKTNITYYRGERPTFLKNNKWTLMKKYLGLKPGDSLKAFRKKDPIKYDEAFTNYRALINYDYRDQSKLKSIQASIFKT